MTRIVVALVIGLVFGAAGTYYLLKSDERALQRPVADALQANVTSSSTGQRSAAPPGESGGGFSERAAAYRIAASADADALPRLVEETAARPPLRRSTAFPTRLRLRVPTRPTHASPT